jgi:pre-rRNA-processing protein TSR1
MVQHLEDNQPKMQLKIRESLLYYMTHHFPSEEKLFSCGSQRESLNALRHITAQQPKGINWRDRHSYLIAEHLSISKNQDNDLATLKITGFVRGNNFSADRLVHIPKFGDFQISRIISATNQNEDDRNVEVLDEPSNLQETLIAEITPNPLDAEQTWPTEEELNDAEMRIINNEHMNVDKPFGDLDDEPFGDIDDEHMTPFDNDGMSIEPKKLLRGPVAPGKKRVPKGTSSYQAAWIVEEAQDEDAEDIDEEETPDFNLITQPLSDNEEEIEEYEDVELENRSICFDVLDEDEEQRQYLFY